MKLESKGTKAAVSIPQAEIISRLWQAIAFLEEVRVDMERQLPPSASREGGEKAVTASVAELLTAAAALAPGTTRPVGVPKA